MGIGDNFNTSGGKTKKFLAELQNTLYKDIDVENACLPKDEKEWSRMLTEERVLRKALRAVEIFDKTDEEVVQLMSEGRLTKVLLEWSAIHRRNRACQLKKGVTQILVVPRNLTLLGAAKIVEQQI